jgi:hypothetical protein
MRDLIVASRFRRGIRTLWLTAIFILWPAICLAQCLSLGGPGFILVKTTFSNTIVVGTPNCTQDTTKEIYDFNFAPQGFSAQTPAAVIWSGSADPNVHDPNVLTQFPVTVQNGLRVGPFQIHASSLKDLGVYNYLFTGDTDDGTYEYPMTSEVMPFVIGNSPPNATPSISGNLKVGNTLSFVANATDPDHGSAGLHFTWSIATRPAGSPSNLSSTTAVSPTLALHDKHDIGHWVVHLDLADQEGELKGFDFPFEVINQPPTLTISGPTSIDALDHLQLTADPAIDADGETITWVWDIVASPPMAALQPHSGYSTSQSIDFVTGPHDIGTWTFKCVATDEHGASAVPQTVNVEVKAIPPKITMSGPDLVKVGQGIHKETTTLQDGYGGNLQFKWEVWQAPVPAGVPLGVLSTSATVDFATSANDVGTWRFKLTVTDQVGQTADAITNVLVDTDPIASILGPDQTGNLSLALNLDGSGSSDPDAAVAYLHVDPIVNLAPGIKTYQWNVLAVPGELYGSVFPGPVADVLNVDGSASVLHIPAGRIQTGDWLFELVVTDGEGATASTSHAVQVLDEGLPPIAILTPPRIYAVDVISGLTATTIGVDGSASFDLDNLIGHPYAPGLGITNYDWSVFLGPPGCSLPNLPSGSSATAATLFAAGSLIAPSCQGFYTIALSVTDDDTPTAKTSIGTTSVIIGNCTGAVCIDSPTQVAPDFVLFSDKTDVIVYYHLNSALYDLPIFAAGLRIRMDIFHESDLVNPAYSKDWDVDLLPTDKGGFLVVHWPGFTNGGTRPQSGKYTVTLQLVDSSSNPTGYSTTQPDSIRIQALDVSILDTTDTFVSVNALPTHADHLEVHYQVQGQQPGNPGYDELRYEIFNNADVSVHRGSVLGGPFNGTFVWDGQIGADYLTAGAYTIQVEILVGGASLGKSAKYQFRAYKAGIGLASIPDSDTETPGAFIKEGDTIDVTVRLDNNAPTLAGAAQLKTANEPGTLSARDGANPVDIDAGVTIPTTSLAAPKVYTVKGEKTGAAGKTELTISYLPTGAAATKTASATGGITVVHAHIVAVSSDPATQATNGVFVEGSRSPADANDAANFGPLHYHMRPVRVDVQPDISGATVDLTYESGDASILELYPVDAPNKRVDLPKHWTTADFNSHKLDVPMLAYGKAFGEVVLKLTYKNGSTTYGEERIKFRVQPFAGAVGVGTVGAAFPFFRVVRTVNEGSQVNVALDPVQHNERVGRKAAVYVVAHKKSAADWVADPSLVDVAGGPTVVTINPGSIAANLSPVWAAAGAGAYDVVFDFGNFPDDPALFAPDGRLDPGDILDSVGDNPSVIVESSMTASAAGAIATSVYGMVTPSTTAVPANYDGLMGSFPFRLRGQVVYPTTLSAPTPLVVFAHGNHTPRTVKTMAFPVEQTVDALTSDENFKGYTYLQEHLARRGYITLSVDLDEMEGDPDFIGLPPIAGYGIKLRAWVTLKNIEKVLSDAAIAGGALVGKIDPNRIHLVGHSRGGEAVIDMLHLLKTPAARPTGGTLAGFTDASIKGIVSLSPVTASISTDAILPQDVPYLLIYGSADGDVNGAEEFAMPFRHYDRATKDKFAIRVMGANHNNFNESWNYDDATQTPICTAQPCDWHNNVVKQTRVPPVGSGLITGDQQRNVAKAYITAFLALIDQQDVGARNFFLEPPARLRPLGVDPTVKLHGQARLVTGVTKSVVDDYTGASFQDLIHSSSDQTVAATASSLSENKLQDKDFSNETEAFNRFFQESNGALFSWTGAAEYTENLAGADQDLRGAGYISFRIAQQPKDARTVALGGDMTVTVEIEDTGGKSAISLGVVDTVPGIYEAVGLETATGTGTATVTSLAVTAVMGTIFQGATVTGTGVPAGTTIVSQQSGPLGGNGTYITSQATTANAAALNFYYESTSAAFKTFRIPVAGFATDGSSIDLAHISKIRLKLGAPGDSLQGRVAITDLEIEK